MCRHQEGRRQVQAVLPVAVAAVMATLRGVLGTAARDKGGDTFINVEVLQFSRNRAMFVLKHIEIVSQYVQHMACVAKVYVRNAIEVV